MASYITDLTHFLTKDGRLAALKGQGKRFAEFLTQVVAYASAPPTLQTSASRVSCVGVPGRKRCEGTIEAGIAFDTRAVHWHCSVCGNRGTISNWQGTFWDRSADTTAH